MKTGTKVALVTGGVFLGSLIVYVTKECIKEYNNVICENDRLRQYIADELIKHEVNVDVTLSDGKRIVRDFKVNDKSIKMISEHDEGQYTVKEFNNGFKMLVTKGA